MSLIKRWRRWTARMLHVGCLTSALFPGWAWAQDVAKTDKHYTKNMVFHLPVDMPATTRLETKEVCLYVKQNGGDWARVETAPATATHFTSKVSREGEYWFTLVTVSKSGKQTPADLAKAPPDRILKVVVDTTPPVLDVQPATASEGGALDFAIRCNAIDPNLVPESLKAVSKTDKGDRPLEQVPGQPGLFRIRGTELLPYPVRVSVSDRAGNTASRDVNIGDIVKTASRPDEKFTPTAHKIATPPALPPGLVEIPTSTPGKLETPVVPVIPNMDSPPTTLITPVPPAPLTAAAPAKTLPEVMPATPPKIDGPARPGVVVEKGGVPRQILNTPQVAIDYRIDHKGPSGVSRVDVYLTSDNCQTWKKVREYLDQRNPAEIELPGEGLFGLKIVITNGNGFGGTPPVRGEQPTCWVEVDTTAPHVKLQSIEPVTQNGFLEIRWIAADTNMANEPVSLFFRARPDTPWQPIVTGVKNEGVHRWAFPRDMGNQFWIKAEVADQAGNVSRAETGPVILDMSEPRAAVVGISGATVRPIAPPGN